MPGEQQEAEEAWLDVQMRGSANAGLDDVEVGTDGVRMTSGKGDQAVDDVAGMIQGRRNSVASAGMWARSSLGTNSAAL